MSFSKLKAFIWHIKNIFQLFTIKLSYSCRIEEIDTKKQSVAVTYRGVKTIIKMSFYEAICDTELIAQLSPIQACYLGGYYGRALRSSLEGRQTLRPEKNMSFLLNDLQGRYKIIFLNRDGNIGYYDKKTDQEFVEHPVVIANNKLLLSRFDPNQACYIGIEAGMSIEKALSSNQFSEQLQNLIKKPPKLRIVK